MKWPLQSLRTRLSLALFVAFTAVIGGTAWWIESTLSAHMARDFDQGLLAKANNLATLVEQENGVVEFDYVARFQPEFERSESPEYLQIWLGDGLELMRSPRLESDLGQPVALAARLSEPLPEPRFCDTLLANGRRVRQVLLCFVPKSSVEEAEAPTPATAAAPVHQIVMAVARGREPLDAALQSLHRSLLLATLGAALLGIALIGAIIGLGLRPVRSIAQQVARLGTDALDARIDTPDAPTELSPVVHQVNALLARLQEARQRERRFAGNVAHELRTPVSELRSLASVAQRWPEDIDAVRGFFGDVSQVAQRMETIIRDLLLLARIQGGVENAVFAPVALQALVDEVAARHASHAHAPPVRLDIPAGIDALSDRSKLTIVLDNLLGNAFAYRRPGTEVVCRGGADGGRFWLEVQNIADPMDPAELEHLCEPFWRGDEARSAPDHAGLGLALVAAIGGLLQLQLRFTQDPHGVFVARIEGPAGATNNVTPAAVTPTPRTFPSSLQRPA